MLFLFTPFMGPFGETKLLNWVRIDQSLPFQLLFYKLYEKSTHRQKLQRCLSASSEARSLRVAFRSFSARVMSKASQSPRSSYWLSLIVFYSLDSVSSIVDKSLLVIINTVYPIYIFIDGGPSE